MHKRHFLRKRSSGQALVESAILIPFLLAIIFNAINFGYFFYVALNMSASVRSGVLYSILGPETPVNTANTFNTVAFAPAGSTANCVGTPDCTVRYVMYQDMTGSLPQGSPNSASVKVCSQSLGTTTSGGATKANCQTFATSSASGVAAGTTTNTDPENTTGGFILHQVEITYNFRPLIPTTAFGAALLTFHACTTSGGGISCTVTRRVYMRAM